jgi:hypothetical protein
VAAAGASGHASRFRTPGCSAGGRVTGRIVAADDSSLTLLTFGVRAFGKRLSAGFGLVYVFPNSIEGWPFIPWGDFSITW